MRTTQQLSITLPNDMALAVKSKVAAGEYATESEVIRDGLRALMARDRAVDHWLRGEVATAYDASVADPGRALSLDQVRAGLAAAHAKHADSVPNPTASAVPSRTNDMNAERSPTTDEQAGIEWWNGLTEAMRAHWLKVANTAVPAEAWARFKAGDDATKKADSPRR